MVTCHCDGLKDAQSQIDLFFAEKEYWDLVEETKQKVPRAEKFSDPTRDCKCSCRAGQEGAEPEANIAAR